MVQRLSFQTLTKSERNHQFHMCASCSMCACSPLSSSCVIFFFFSCFTDKQVIRTHSLIQSFTQSLHSLGHGGTGNLSLSFSLQFDTYSINQPVAMSPSLLLLLCEQAEVLCNNCIPESQCYPRCGNKERRRMFFLFVNWLHSWQNDL